MLDDPLSIYDDFADLFEALHTGRDDERAFYRSLVTAPGVRALDLACGTGVIAAELAGAGARVTGLDASATMLERAARKVSGATFVRGDMRSFDLGARFLLVTCACNSLQHLETDEALAAALACVHRHLEPDGLFAFDAFNPHPTYLGGPRREMPVQPVSLPGGSAAMLVEDTDYDPATRLLHIDWRIVAQGHVLRSNRTTMRQLFPTSLDAALRDAGFDPVEKSGDFRGGAFVPSSAKQVVVARRRRA